MENRVYFPARNRTLRASLTGSHIAPFFLVLLLAFVLPAAGRDKNKMVYGEGLLVEIPLPISDVQPVVEEVAGSSIIHGSKEYNKDEFIEGAKPAESSSLFGKWDEGGKVFYKVREKALDPRNFQNSQDEGTLAVRYVIKAEGKKKTILRIDALFQEDIRRTIHKSNGSVEGAEYRDIHDHLEAAQLMKKEDAEANARRQEALEKKKQPVDNTDLPFLVAESSSKESEGAADSRSKTSPTYFDPITPGTPAPVETPSDAVPSSPAPSQPQPSQPQPLQPQPSQPQPSPGQPIATIASANSGQSLEQRVKGLRREVERLVKSPGAALRSAPFHTASNLATLPTGTEVLILISSPYWYGVETHDGQHGWIMRDELEALP